MASTVIRGAQIKDSTVQRHDLDTSTVGQAVVTKLVQGSGITLSSTGADSGTGDVTVSTSAIPLASSSTSGLMNQTSGNTTDFIDGTNSSQALQPVIWSVRLRSFNAVGNPSFEIAQRNCRASVVNPATGTFIEDRWSAGNSALNPTFQGVAISGGAGTGVTVPGTGFVITKASLRITIGTQKASLAAADTLYLQQNVEGPQFRELMGSDPHSAQVLVRSSVANLKFGIYIKDPTGSRTLTKLCTLGAANTITLIQAPNLPVFPSAGTFVADPGSAGYSFGICLACGSTFTSPANDTWQNSNFLQAVGADNFLANAVGSSFDVFYVGHEPGALCTTPQDCPWQQNYDNALRYYWKSVAYPTAVLVPAGTSDSELFVAGTTAAAFGSGKFPKAMAKIPTCRIWSPGSGANNTVYDTTNGSAVAVTGIGTTAIRIGNIAGTFTAGRCYIGCYDADTGW